MMVGLFHLIAEETAKTVGNTGMTLSAWVMMILSIALILGGLVVTVRIAFKPKKEPEDTK
jgi:prolipoprotein diacylglyceryltransferase